MTIKEIAEIAKVSPGTVDRVLHNRGEVSPKTKEKILKIIHDGNYTPNIFARNLVLNKTYRIASLLPKYSANDYWEGPAKGIKRAADELKMLGIRNDLYFFKQDDATEFENVALKLLHDNPDGVILAPVIYDKALWFSELCAQKNIPVIIIDSDIPKVSKISYIGQNAYKSGYLAAKLLDITGNSNSVFIISLTTTGDNNAVFTKRIEGFTAYFNELKNPAEISHIELQLEDPNFEVQLTNFVRDLGKGEKLFVPNSKVHFVARVIKKLKKNSEVRLVGYDLIKHNLHYLNNETIDFLLNQNPEQQGYKGLHLFYKFLVLKQDIKDVLMPLEIVTKENLEYLL